MKQCGGRRFTRIFGRFFVGIIWILLSSISSTVFGLTASSASSHIWQASKQWFRFSLGVSFTGQRGDMTYTIQGSQNGGWKSELEWPLESVFYGGGIFSVTFMERLHVNVGAWKSLNEDSGTMKDRDWFDNLRPLLLAIYDDDTAVYGEFDTTIDSLQLDGNLRFDILRRSPIALGVIAGYAYITSHWATGNGFQRSPLSSYNIGNVTGEGIAYEQTINTPYLGLAISVIPKSFPVDLSLFGLYSPLARCDDIDDHILREKESTGHTQGTFFSFGSEMHFYFASSWTLSGTVNYSHYDLDGSQDQIFYGGPNLGTRFYNIDMTVTGSHLSVGFLMSYIL